MKKMKKKRKEKESLGIETNHKKGWQANKCLSVTVTKDLLKI